MWLQTAVLALSSIAALTSAKALAINDNCHALLLDLDVSAGIGAYSDEQCVGSKDADCFSQICRLCRFSVNEQTKFYRACPDSLDPLPQDDFESGEASTCRASIGDQRDGIEKFYDESCARGGVGCVGGSFCRFCKTRETFKSSHLEPCPSAPAPAPTPQPPPFNEGATCDAAVRNAQLPNIEYVIDGQCAQSNPRLVGCVANTRCQLCRTRKNEANQYLISCRVLRDQLETVKVQVKASAAANDESASLRSGASSTGQSGATIGACVGAVCCIALVGISIRKHKKKSHPKDREGSLVHVARSESIARL